jgi:mannose-6-phosphate isomerase-like protein (cupin superfamily)
MGALAQMDDLKAHVAHERDTEVEGWDGIVSWRTLLSADRTPTAGFTVGTAEIEPGASVEGALHHHAHHEFYYFTSGNGSVYLDGKEETVEPGAIVFVPGTMPHFVRNTGTETLRFLYAFATDEFSEVDYVFP